MDLIKSLRSLSLIAGMACLVILGVRENKLKGPTTIFPFDSAGYAKINPYFGHSLRQRDYGLTPKNYSFGKPYDAATGARCEQYEALGVDMSQQDSLLLANQNYHFYYQNPYSFYPLSSLFHLDDVCEKIYMLVFREVVESRTYKSIKAEEAIYKHCYRGNTPDPVFYPPSVCEFFVVKPDEWQFETSFPDEADILKLWKTYDIDANMQIFVTGGINSLSIPWIGTDAGTTFAQAVGQQMLNLQGYVCSLESPRTTPLSRSSIGSFIVFGSDQPVLKIPWVNLVVASLQNINLQLSNQYKAIQGAAIGATLAAFTIDDFYPTPDSTFALNTLTGIGTIFSIVGGFLPAIGPGISAVGAILPAVGTFISSSISSSTSDEVGQRTYAKKVEDIYAQLTKAFGNATKSLFDGESVEGVNITDMMSGGVWANSSALTPLPEIETQIEIEVLSRSIDSLWKTQSNNKMWVQFTALGDFEKNTTYCDADRFGPQDSKYCADSGVYYAYNFIEDGDLFGHLGYPWGGDKLSNLNLSLSVGAYPPRPLTEPSTNVM